MEIEYEATFKDINKDEVRTMLEKAGAELAKPEFLQKRATFNPPVLDGRTWLRVRDEQDKITMSIKKIDGDKIHNQQEICLEVNDFASAVSMLNLIGCKEKSYQENLRELWMLDGVEIVIDEWPFLEPLVEVEGKSEEAVKMVSEKIGFDYNKALFCSASDLYKEKYNISLERINNETPLITFEIENPFL